MSALRLDGTEPTAIRVTHVARGLDPDRPGFEVWYIAAAYATGVTTIIASCDYPDHAAAVSSALAIAHGVPVIGDEPPRTARTAARPPGALPVRRPGPTRNR